MATTNSSANVTTGKPSVSGAIYYAEVGTTLPTDAVSTISSSFTPLGYMSDDGLTNTNAPDSDTIKAWGGDTVYTYQKEKSDEFQFTLIEALRESVLKFVYGANNVTSATTTAPLTVKANSTEMEYQAVVIDMILNGNTPKRICIPKAKISDLGDITYSDEDAVGYEVTLSCAPDDEGNTHYEYIGTKTKA